MIDKELFIQILQKHQEQTNRLDKISEFGLDIWNTDLVEYGNLMFDRVIKAYFTEEGSEWIFWWLYERDGNSNMKAYDEDNDEIPFDTIEDLWRFVKQYRK